MADNIPQSVAYTVVFKAYLSDGVTAATGKTIAITISKNTAAFGNPSVGATNATEIASGWYYVALSTTDTGTLGPLIVHGAVAGVDNVDLAFYVVNANTGGWAALPNALPGATNGLFIAGANAATSITTALTANITGNVSGSVNSVATGVTVTTNNDKTGYTASTVSDKTGYALTVGERTSIADAMLDEVAGVETGLTVRQWLRLAAAALFGKLSGVSTSAPKFRDTGDTKNRISASTSSDGRSSVTLDSS